MFLNKCISFVCAIEEVNDKVAIFSEVLRMMTASSWEVAPATVTPVAITSSVDGNITTSKVMVSIAYAWNWEFPMPQNFEAFFGNSKKAERNEYIEKMCSSWGE